MYQICLSNYIKFPKYLKGYLLSIFFRHKALLDIIITYLEIHPILNRSRTKIRNSVGIFENNQAQNGAIACSILQFLRIYVTLMKAKVISQFSSKAYSRQITIKEKLVLLLPAWIVSKNVPNCTKSADLKCKCCCPLKRGWGWWSSSGSSVSRMEALGWFLALKASWARSGSRVVRITDHPQRVNYSGCKLTV